MKAIVLALAVLLFSPLVALKAEDVPQAVLHLALEPPVVNTKPGPEYDDRVRTGNMINRHRAVHFSAKLPPRK